LFYKQGFMSTLEIKQELVALINQSDDAFVKNFYNIINVYKIQILNDEMIAESELGIKEGRIHSQDEVIEMIKSWEI